MKSIRTFYKIISNGPTDSIPYLKSKISYLKSLLFCILFIFTLHVSAQNGLTGFNYQAVVRNTEGEVLANQTVNLRFGLLKGSANGMEMYAETQQLTTNQLGLLTHIISRGNPVKGTFAGLDFAAADLYLKVDIDLDGGNNFQPLGTAELMAVPYALYAANSLPGPPGPVGAPGPMGMPGSKGDKGDPGQTGLKGDKGDTGPIGPKGGKGDQGGVGAKGDKGDPGPVGPQGVKGDKGDQGNVGPMGAKGDKGDKGDTGAIGPQGPPGSLTGAAGGDLGGNYPNPTVTGLQTRPVANTAPANGQVLKWDGNANAWVPANEAAGTAGWGLNGNAGINPAINYIGTSDGQPFLVKVNFCPSGQISPSSYNTSWGYRTFEQLTSGNFNTAFGANALLSNTTGPRNTAIGSRALESNTTGSDNVAIGPRSLFLNTTGADNTAVGGGALNKNTEGNSNTAVGNSSLFANTIGNDNTAIGNNALNRNTTGFGNAALGNSSLYYNSTGDANTAVGSQSLYDNTTGEYNTAVGRIALNKNTTGSNNTALGANTLFSITTANGNTAVGSNALHFNTAGGNTAIGTGALENNTTGDWNLASGFFALNSNTIGSNNTAVGRRALFANSTGSGNTALGTRTLPKNTTGNANTAIGYFSLLENTEGFNNVGIGVDALDDNVSGDNNSALGVASGPISPNLTNTTALGYGAQTTASNQVRIGNSNVTSIGGFAPWTNLSDERFKTHIQAQTHGLDFILKLKPITYHLDIKKLNTFLGKDDKSPDGLNKDYKQGIHEKENILYSGFSAQQVEKATQSIGYDFSGLHKPQNKRDHYRLAYAEFVVPLVKAVQEQQEMIAELQQQNQQLLAETKQLKTANKEGKEQLTRLRLDFALRLQQLEAALVKQPGGADQLTNKITKR